MAWEAALWCGLALAGSVGIPALTAWLTRRRGSVATWMASVLPWLHLLPLYLALVTGAVLGRDAGLHGQVASDWVSGAASAGLLLALAVPLLWWRGRALPWPPAWHALVDEARWALYRGSGALWFGSMIGGASIGAALGVVEWVLVSRPWQARASLAPLAWTGLGRVLASSLLFVLTHNAWLTRLGHLALLIFMERMTPSRHSEGVGGPRG